jgi:flagellar hook-associated protein 1 FlgK
VHTQGVGLDGEGGRNLFNPIDVAQGAATALALSSDVAGAPNNLAAAQTAGLPGDNRNALLLSDLSGQNIAGGGRQTVQNAFGSLVAGGGSALRSAMDRQTQADATLAQVDAMRESISGVSTDDEMISLMRYQRAYQASLRVIETADQMMQQLLNLGR